MLCLGVAVKRLILLASTFLAHYRNSRWDDLKGVYEVVTLPELFEYGLKGARDKNCLGHRPVASSEPLTFAPEYTWQSYAEVDTRRKAVGSAIEALYRSGRFPINSDFEGVGVWAVNRPGVCIHPPFERGSLFDA